MIKLNLGRNCLRYLIRLYAIKEIYLPFYSCNTLWQACRKEACKIKFYHIGRDFMPINKIPKEAYVLYINYFGMCDKICETLCQDYPNLIIDNTQAFYSDCRGLASFNSLRKFFSVPNGAYLYINSKTNPNLNKDTSSIFPAKMKNNYLEFLKNELFLDKQEVMFISDKVSEIMKTIDFEHDKTERLKNFWDYAEKYGKVNTITLTPSDKEIPYCYPLSTTNENVLTELKNYNYPLLSLWGEISKEFPEYKFVNNTVALPLI